MAGPPLEINDFLASAETVTIPYRCNRAVLFHSNLFHKSDRVRFRSGYLNRRMERHHALRQARQGGVSAGVGRLPSFRQSPGVPKKQKNVVCPRLRSRCNRAVLFHSNLFHKSDRVRFRPGYLNRRMNVTMLFGKRGKGG